MIRCLSTVLGRVRDLPVSLLWRALATATAERDDAPVMTEQHALFPEPHWTDRWQVGDRVRSTYTSNVGKVTKVEPGRHLLIRWAKWLPHEPNGYVARHSSDQGIEAL